MLNYIYNIIIILVAFSALMTLFCNNPVYSVLYLITLFFNLTFLLVFMGFDFLGFLFLSIYIGAIAIFFLFVVMMINIPIYIRKSNILKPFTFTIILFLFFLLFDLLLSTNLYNLQVTLQTYSKINLGLNYLNSTEVIAALFYTQYFIFFLLLACILLLSMLGSMLIIDKFKNKE